MRRSAQIITGLVLAISIAACTQGEAKTISTTASSKSVASKSSSSVPTPAKTPRDDVKIPILVYHHIRKQQGWAKTTWSWKMTVSPGVFDTQMKWIHDHGYTTITLDTFVSIRKKEIYGPEKPIVITFDDNNLNAYDNGVPILEKYGLTATFYQITDHLKNHNTIDEARTKDLLARGFDVQSHTVTHTTLTTVPTSRLNYELTESKRVLEELTGKPILHIAYPGTAHNQKVRDAAKAAGYVTGTIMDPRTSTAKDDLMKLPRIMMTDDTNLAKTLP